jgi:hypothetical protein
VTQKLLPPGVRADADGVSQRLERAAAELRSEAGLRGPGATAREEPPSIR